MAFIPPHLRKQKEEEAMEDGLGLKERMSRDLERGKYDCCVCVEVVRSADAVWGCDVCYGVVHLDCVKMWGKQSSEGGTWRCPKCQSLYTENPSTLTYSCFCKKSKNPPAGDGYSTPHTCGMKCERMRNGTSCPHPCGSLCHPGPCPPCTLSSPPKNCFCGKITYHTGCSDPDKGRSCGETCNKLLSCGVHHCKDTCHSGDCSPCEEEFEQSCFCGKIPSTVRPCKAPPASPDKTETPSTPCTYSCSELCGKTLKCGAHKCALPCHFGDCHDCERDPALVSKCPCNKTLLAALSDTTRVKCTDPIPTCRQICKKPMSCGVSSHLCDKPCHEGACGECTQPAMIRCKCGGKQVRMRCDDRQKPPGTSVSLIVENVKKEELDIFSGTGKKGRGKAKKPSTAAATVTLPFTCMSKCTAKKTCGKHTCNTVCCPDKGHIHSCSLPCNRQLPCGRHRCEAGCHTGSCPPCLQGGFTELSCRCGSTFIEPPIPCGTEPPACPLMCRIPRPCGHPAHHKCHFEDCPPCTVMVNKRCASHNSWCDWLSPCHVPVVTCRNMCRKPLSCAKHFCNRQCHSGPCTDCPLLCSVPNPCGHPCNTSCHAGPCPPCCQDILIMCKCGRVHKNIKCGERESYPPFLECGDACKSIEATARQPAAEKTAVQ
eukprot:TRINITY_DN9748_c2_g1_i1.p1 TRINITY_DN9748_c2_g1~~TRINITY_DN9748_c2_g1_i1.p1  ORF type:complete len:655 (+),score=79.13 TRINITY_DN9748_c2_g1_i1:94-2058(+)